MQGLGFWVLGFRVQGLGFGATKPKAMFALLVTPKDLNISQNTVVSKTARKDFYPSGDHFKKSRVESLSLKPEPPQTEYMGLSNSNRVPKYIILESYQGTAQ